MATSRIADSVGRVLGERYRLTRPLGVGASAHVFAAEDVRLRRRVAIKVLHPALASEEAFLRRFRREAQAVASLRHPGIMRVYDWGEDDGAPYLVMELLEGGSLRSLLDRGHRLTPEQAAVVGADAARALEYAHRQGLVHRDIKPANLLFDDEGRVSVADFGLARALAEASWTEPAGAVVGTARYASPELVRGEHLDSKADVYSLALVLVEAITGQVPFVADTAFGTLMARVGRSLEAPEETGPLKPVLEGAGAADPAARMDAGSLARALDAVATRLPLPAPIPRSGPLEGGYIERDDVSPTEMPGRTKLFDRAEWEDADDLDRPSSPAVGPSADAATPVSPATATSPATAASPGPSVASTGAGAGAVRAADVSAAAVTAAAGEAGVAAAHALPEAAGGPDAAASDDPDAGGPTPPPKRRRRLRRLILVAVAVLAAGGSGTAWAVLAGPLQPTEPVPDVVGQARTAAAATLTHDHLKMVVTASAYDPSRPAGAVLSQVQRPGTKLRRGTAVRVTLSLGPQPVPVPDLRHDDIQAAEQVLQNLGLKWTVTSQPDMTVPAGQVVESLPRSGTLIPGQTVAIVVSSGKPKVPVPAITAGSETFAQASAALSQAGLVAQQTQDWSTTVPNGDVISVSPPPGSQVTVGSPVTVTVSKGPHLVPVPAVANESVGTASEVLGAQGFNVAGVQGNPVNTVRGTSPAAGTQVLYGSSVTIITG